MKNKLLGLSVVGVLVALVLLAPASRAQSSLSFRDSIAKYVAEIIAQKLLGEVDMPVSVNAPVPVNAPGQNFGAIGSLRLEDYLPVVMYNEGLYTEKPISGTSTTTLDTTTLVVNPNENRVGILTATPTSTLQVLNGSVHFQAVGGAEGLYFNPTTVSLGIATTSPWGKLGIEMNTSPSLVIGNNASSTPTLYVGGVNEANSSAGSVGLNTSSPQVPLHVVSQSGEGTAPKISGGQIAIFQQNNSSGSDGYVSIIAGSAGSAFLTFGDKDSSITGQLEYDNATNLFDFNKGAEISGNASTTGSFVVGGNTMNVATTSATTTGQMIVNAPAGTATTSIIVGDPMGTQGTCLEFYRERVAYRMYVNSAGNDVVVQVGRCKD